MCSRGYNYISSVILPFVQGVYYGYKTIAGLFREGHFCCFRVNITKYFAQSIEFAKVKIYHHQNQNSLLGYQNCLIYCYFHFFGAGV